MPTYPYNIHIPVNYLYNHITLIYSYNANTLIYTNTQSNNYSVFRELSPQSFLFPHAVPIKNLSDTVKQKHNHSD